MVLEPFVFGAIEVDPGSVVGVASIYTSQSFLRNRASSICIHFSRTGLAGQDMNLDTLI